MLRTTLSLEFYFADLAALVMNKNS